MLDRQVVIEAVARKHGILLGEDDPILSFLAVHDVILDEYLDRFNRSDANRQEKLEELLDRFSIQITQAIETAVGRERERLRKANLGQKNTMSIVLWSIIGASMFISSALLFFLFP